MIHLLSFRIRLFIAVLALVFLLIPFMGTGTAAQPVRGGDFVYVIPASGFPSMDAHRETTYAVIHPLAPYYSVLVRINPDNPMSTSDYVGDVAESWTVSPDGRTFTFKIRKGIKFHDGSPLTSRDVKASWDKIVFPPEGVLSARVSVFKPLVASMEAPDDYTFVIKLKFATELWMPALANPYNWIYDADILDKDMHWYEKNVMGTGPFKFKEYVAGSHIAGVRYPDYHFAGQPYLDSVRGIFIKKQAPQVAAIRGGRAMVNFRALPPKAIEDLKRAMGDGIAVQQSTWNCSLFVTPNSKAKPFDDPRVRRALNLALDRWGGSKYLSRIAIVKTVGGLVYPFHPLAASKAELQQFEGYWPDIEKSRKKARELLREAGVPEGFKFRFHNRGVEQPYKVSGVWVIDQWRKIGLNAEQWVEPTAPFWATLRKKSFDVTMDFNCESVVNPLTDMSKFLSDDISKRNFGNYQDRELDQLHERMIRETNFDKLKGMCRQFEKRIIEEEGHTFPLLWWNRTVPHNARMNGWKISPSHYLNQDLSNVWLAPK
jgi:peptide/nickel transport system substrate-binding protein